jgi:hypothetical protein
MVTVAPNGADPGKQSGSVMRGKSSAGIVVALVEKIIDKILDMGDAARLSTLPYVGVLLCMGAYSQSSCSESRILVLSIAMFCACFVVAFGVAVYDAAVVASRRKRKR